MHVIVLRAKNGSFVAQWMTMEYPGELEVVVTELPEVAWEPLDMGDSAPEETLEEDEVHNDDAPEGIHQLGVDCGVNHRCVEQSDGTMKMVP